MINAPGIGLPASLIRQTRKTTIACGNPITTAGMYVIAGEPVDNHADT